MADVRSDVLPDLDEARALIDELGLRRYSVTIRRRQWSGGKPGLGTATNTDLVLSPRPRVREISVREVAGSGGTFESGDFRIDKITPRYTAPTTGGYTPAMLVISPANAAQDVVIVLVGDDGTKVCTLVESSFDRSFGYSMVVRPRRETP
jgi:hypothetical protein